MTQNTLRSSEWLLVGSFLLILASLVLISQISARRAAAIVQLHELKPEEPVDVAFEGAVARPGTYRIHPGTTLRQALKKARPKPQANLRDLDLDSRIEGPLRLTLLELEEITISLEGAVASPGPFRCPVKTRVCDLKTKIEFAPDADPAFLTSFLKKRRQLRDGETLFIPLRKKESCGEFDASI